MWRRNLLRDRSKFRYINLNGDFESVSSADFMMKGVAKEFVRARAGPPKGS